MELALFVYAAHVVSNIGCGIAMVLTIGVTILVFANLVALIECSYNTEIAVSIRQKSVTCLKVGIVLLVFGVLLPSKDTMYTMAGAYAGQQVAEMEQVPEILTKTLAVINKELDTKLAE